MRRSSQLKIQPKVSMTLLWTAGLFWTAAVSGLAGCANPGPPRPPSLHLPSPVKDLRVERVGEQVRLAWTTSTDTTDDVSITPPLHAEICRDPLQPSVRPTPPSQAPCTVVQRLAVTPGPSTAIDPLPPSLRADPVQLLQYRVRLLNASDHAADPSPPAFAAAGVAPPAVNDLRAAASPAGTRIVWQPRDFPAASVLLRRTLSSPAPQTVGKLPAPPPVPAKQPSSARPAPQTTPQTVSLEGPSAGPDPGGLVDPSGQRDATYSYIAWRSRTVIVDGKTLTLRSPDSPPLTLTLRDTTPPASPSGLAAIADGAAVDLSWEPNTEPDLAGYWVERSPAPDPAAASGPAAETWRRLNQAPLQVPAFRDQPPGAGSFRYRVLAVDASGNLSRPAAPARVTVYPLSTP